MKKYLLWALCIVISIPFFFSIWAFLRETAVAREIAPAHGAYAQAGDVQMYYQTAGDASDRIVILIHGMAAWSETWRESIDALAADGWYVIALDMPPFGFSDRPIDHSYWRVSQATRIDALLDSLDISSAVVVAHSYGSRAAFEFAMRNPERVKRLVVVDPALNGIYREDAPLSPIVRGTLAAAPLRYALSASTITNPLLAKKLLQIFMHQKEAATSEVVAVYRAPGARFGSTRDFGYWLAGFADGYDTGLSSDKTSYAALKTRVDIIWGREDTTTPLAQGEMLESYLPNAELHVLDGLGHMPHIEAADTFNSLLVRILKN